MEGGYWCKRVTSVCHSCTFRYDVIQPLPPASSKATHDVATAEDYILHRILHGVPEGPIDIPPVQAFPMDSNFDFMGGRASFQNLVMPTT